MPARRGALAGAVCVALGLALAVYFQLTTHSYVRYTVLACWRNELPEWSPGGSALARFACTAAKPLHDASINPAATANVSSHLGLIAALVVMWAIESTKQGARGLVRFFGLPLLLAFLIGIAPAFLLMWLPAWLHSQQQQQQQQGATQLGAPRPAQLAGASGAAALAVLPSLLRHVVWKLPQPAVFGLYTAWLLGCVLVAPLGGWVGGVAARLVGQGALAAAPATPSATRAAHARAFEVYTFLAGALFLHHAANVAAFIAAGAPWGGFAELLANRGVREWGAAHFLFVDNIALAACGALFILLDGGGWGRLGAFVGTSGVAGLGTGLAAYLAVRERRLAAAVVAGARGKSD